MAAAASEPIPYDPQVECFETLLVEVKNWPKIQYIKKKPAALTGMELVIQKSLCCWELCLS